MAKSGLSQLEELIESIRREAYGEGYAAAMQVIQRAAGGGATPTVSRRGRPPAAAAPATPAAPQKPAPAKPVAAAPRRRRAPRQSGSAAASRPRRGNNAQLVSSVLQAISPQAARPSEIRAAIQRDHNTALAFTSIRHAIGQLEARDAIEQVGDSKTWRIKG